MTFVFPDAKVEAYRRSVFYMKLNSVVDGSTLNCCEQYLLLKAMSEDLLYARIAEPDMSAVNFNFRD